MWLCWVVSIKMKISHYPFYEVSPLVPCLTFAHFSGRKTIQAWSISFANKTNLLQPFNNKGFQSNPHTYARMNFLTLTNTTPPKPPNTGFNALICPLHFPGIHFPTSRKVLISLFFNYIHHITIKFYLICTFHPTFRYNSINRQQLRVWLIYQITNLYHVAATIIKIPCNYWTYVRRRNMDYCSQKKR